MTPYFSPDDRLKIKPVNASGLFILSPTALIFICVFFHFYTCENGSNNCQLSKTVNFNLGSLENWTTKSVPIKVCTIRLEFSNSLSFSRLFHICFEKAEFSVYLYLTLSFGQRDISSVKYRIPVKWDWRKRHCSVTLRCSYYVRGLAIHTYTFIIDEKSTEG